MRYLVIIALFAALTLPAAGPGLQPLDGFILLAAYAAMIHWGREHGFMRWQLLVLDGIHVAYLTVVLFWVLNVVQGIESSLTPMEHEEEAWT